MTNSDGGKLPIFLKRFAVDVEDAAFILRNLNSMERRDVLTTPLDQAIGGLNSLADALIEFESKSRSALGFTETLQYKGISFHVSEQLVIADMRPLAFLGLMEEVTDDKNEAVVRLYERVAPLLLCRHEWVETHLLQEAGIADENGLTTGAFNARVCRLCTAYALTRRLPEVGREFTEAV